MTSVAWSSTDGGMLRPSDWAVRRLITKSNSRGLFDGQVGGAGALEDAVHVIGGAAYCRTGTRPVGHEPAGARHADLLTEQRQSCHGSPGGGAPRQFRVREYDDGLDVLSHCRVNGVLQRRITAELQRAH